MAVEAPLSKFKKNNFKIYIGVAVLFAVIFAYDGYLSKYEWSGRHSFYEGHVKDGKPDDTMRFNQIAPILLVVLVVLLAGRFWAVKNRKLLADESQLVIDGTEKISYDTIQKIDKTYFDSKGYFVITHKDKDGKETNRKLSDRTYDNLAAILNELVAKIS